MSFPDQITDLASSAWLDELSRDLERPRLRATAQQVAEIWSMDRLRFLCERPSLLEEFPEFAVRVRGAFGRRLAEQEQGPSRYSGERLPRAFDVLFSTVAKRTGGTELPKPLSIRARVDQASVVVDLTLFGIANLWLEDAAKAMQDALEGGIAIKSGGRQRVPFRILDIGHQQTNYLDVPSSLGMAMLAFRSPVAVRSGHFLQPDPRSLLRAVPRAAASLARWQGVELVDDWSSVSADVDAIQVDDRNLTPYSFVRNSIRQKDRPIAVHGYLGSITFQGRLQRLAPFLSIAETCGIGSHISLGLGAFDLVATP